MHSLGFSDSISYCARAIQPHLPSECHQISLILQAMFFTIICCLILPRLWPIRWLEERDCYLPFFFFTRSWSMCFLPPPSLRYCTGSLNESRLSHVRHS